MRAGLAGLSVAGVFLVHPVRELLTALLIGLRGRPTTAGPDPSLPSSDVLRPGVRPVGGCFPWTVDVPRARP